MEEVLRKAEEGEFDDPDVGMGAGEWKDVNATAEGEVYPSAETAHQAAATADDSDEIEDGEVDESSEVHNEAGTNHACSSSQLPQPTEKPIIGPQLPPPTSNTAGEPNYLRIIPVTS